MADTKGAPSPDQEKADTCLERDVDTIVEHHLKGMDPGTAADGAMVVIDLDPQARPKLPTMHTCRNDSTPEITIGEGRLGLRTLLEIGEELDRDGLMLRAVTKNAVPGASCTTPRDATLLGCAIHDCAEYGVLKSLKLPSVQPSITFCSIPSQPRHALVTMGYDEVPIEPKGKSSEPGAQATLAAIPEKRDGLDTLSEVGDRLIEADSEESKEPATGVRNAAPDVSPMDCGIWELRTFVVVDGSLTWDASDDDKRAFVTKRLVGSLRPSEMKAIERIDVRPADAKAVMLRVWTRVPTV